jgi:hypothetical protein
MALALRHTRTRLQISPAYADRQDFLVIEDGQVIGRIYEERYVPADVKWFWSITEYVHPALGITTHGRVGSLPVAMEQFKLSWSKVRETSKEQRPAETPGVARRADPKPGPVSRMGAGSKPRRR